MVIGSHVTVGAPRKQVWGRSVKCLGLNAGVSITRLTPYPCFLFFTLIHPISFPLRAFLEMPAAQANNQFINVL